MQSFSRFCYQFSLKVESKYKNKKKCYFKRKNHHYTIKFFIVYRFQRSPTPLMGIWICTTSERRKKWAFCKFHSRGNKALDHSNCSSYSILLWNNLIIFFLFDIWKVSNYVNDVVLVKLKHVSYLFLVFTVAFEQLDACWNWTISVVSALEDVYFRKVSIFERVSKKWL